MKYILDHDYHIHSKLSPCSNDPDQTPERILRYGVENGFKDIVLTDHFWDEEVLCAAETWRGYELISQSLPLPQAEGIRFHFGCEADMDRYSVVGISRKHFDRFDFMIVPVNHLHLGFAKVQRSGFDKKEQAVIFTQRIENLLAMDLPFHKVGLAHLTWEGISGGEPNRVWQDHLDILNFVSDGTFKKLFAEAAERGIGIELNTVLELYKEGQEREDMLRPYRLAKECGCKFYFGSDSHHPQSFAKYPVNAAQLIDLLDLTEEDKFRPFA